MVLTAMHRRRKLVQDLEVPFHATSQSHSLQQCSNCCGIVLLFASKRSPYLHGKHKQKWWMTEIIVLAIPKMCKTWKQYCNVLAKKVIPWRSCRMGNRCSYNGSTLYSAFVCTVAGSAGTPLNWRKNKDCPCKSLTCRLCLFWWETNANTFHLLWPESLFTIAPNRALCKWVGIEQWKKSELLQLNCW